SNILSSATPSESQLYTSSEDYRKNYNDSVKNLLADGAKDYNPFEKRPESGNYVISSQLLHVSGKDDGVSCRLYGGILSLLNLVGVWIVVGIHCDKYCAIASPLRYNQIVTRKRIAVFSLSVWTFSFAVSVTLMVVAPNFKYLGGVCLPVFDNAGKVIYTSCLLVVFILSPAAIFLLVNGKILFIARQHQHRIFSAIFEVMMSAQATVTQQRNPFDMPKMKQKSAWAICEQLISFAVCYCPIVLFLFLECAVHYPINNFLTVVMVGSVLLAPVVNTFLYGIKSATIRKILKNYLRKKISRSAMKCEIQARIPSAQNSRRPSISSTLGFPAIHRSLQRRMSDYLRPDHMPETDSRELVRRSSELSWHPLEEGTPTSSRLRQPMDLDFASDWNPSQVTSASQYLAVPSYEAARCQTSNLRSSSSTESIGTFSMKEPTTEDEFIVTSAEISPAFQNKILTSNKTTEVVRPLVYPFPEDDALRTNGNIRNTISVSMPLYRKGSSTLSSVLSEDPQSATPATPLLCKAYMTPWPKTETSQSTSPYILRTLESLVSVGISQSRLMKSTSFWKGFGFDKESSGNNNNNSLDSLDPGLSVELNEKYKCFEIMIGESVASFPEEETELTEEFPSVI
ncbi:G protein-coupled receptor rhodopsin-like, partial [Trinorchestia longiramus]